MTQIRFTKNELREQQKKLSQLERYLPTLQLKKAMLQLEVNNVQVELLEATKRKEESKKKVDAFSSLFFDNILCNIAQYAKVEHVNTLYENIAGVEIPIFQGVSFVPPSYPLYDSPSWADPAIKLACAYVSVKEEIEVIIQKKRALEKELREVSIRVNLFEKILIPRSKLNIKKIKVFLGDQQLAFVAQAKVAKTKIFQKKK